MKASIAALGICAALLAPAAPAGAQPGVNVQVLLDKPTEFAAADTPVAKVFEQLTAKTGVKFVIDPDVYACLPYGEQTQLTFKVPQTTLRKALSPMLMPLAMKWEVQSGAVRIMPAEALLRMTRRATREELIVLGKLYTEKVQPTAGGASVIDQLRKATGDKDLRLFFHGGQVDEAAALKRAERALPATAAVWLDMLCHGQGLTWYLWGDDIMIVDCKLQIGRQLQKQVSLRYEGADLVTVLLDLAKQAHVQLNMEPGVLDYVSVETRKNFNLMMARATVAQALEVIGGATGLVFLREADGIKVVPSDKIRNAAEGSDTRKRTPFFLKTSVTLPSGGTVDLIIRPDDMPESVSAALVAERERLFKELLRKYPPTTQPTTRPATTEPTE